MLLRVMTILITVKMMSLTLSSFASRSDETSIVETRSTFGVSSGVSSDVLTLTYDSGDDENLTKEALIQACRLLHRKWTGSMKLNEKLTIQVAQSNMNIYSIQKIVFDMEKKLKQSQDKEAELSTIGKHEEVGKNA